MKLIIDTNNLYLSVQRTYGGVIDYHKYVQSIIHPLDVKIAYVSGYGSPGKFISMLEGLGFDVRVKGSANEKGVNFNVEMALEIVGANSSIIVGSSDGCLLPALKGCSPFGVSVYACSIPKSFRSLVDVDCTEIDRSVLYAGRDAATT